MDPLDSDVDRLMDSEKSERRTVDGALAPHPKPQVAPPAVGWMAVASLLLVYASIWTICRPYAGLVHDAKLYALQTLARLRPEVFAGDLFLRFGSQDSFTVFPAIYAPIATAMGIEHAAAALTIGIYVLWLAIGFFIARALSGQRLALLSLGLLIVIPGWYGGYEVIHIGEMYLSARLPAELVALGALLAHVYGKNVLAFAVGFLATLVHPLMGLPMIGLLILTALRSHLGPTVVKYAAITAVLGGTIVALAAPVSSADTLQEWIEIVRTRSGWLFPALWRVSDWQYHGLVILTLVLASRVTNDARTGALAFCSLWLGLAGVGLAAIAGILPEHPILLRMQTWRWMWVPCFLAIVFLPHIFQRLWSQGVGATGRIAAVLLAASWLLADSVGGFLAVAAIAALRLPDLRHVSYSRALNWGAWAVLAFALIANVLPAAQYAANPFDTNQDSLLVQRVVNAVGSGSFGLLVAVSAWMLAMKMRSNVGQAAFAIFAVVALVTLMPRGIRDWTASKYPKATIEAFSAWRAAIPVNAEVLWLDDSMATWLLLERRSYFSQDQLAGILYSPAMTNELLRRAAALTPIAKPEWWTLADISQEAQPRELTPGSLAAICGSPGLDYVVSDRNLGGAKLSARMPLRNVDVYLYECKSLPGIPASL